MKTGRIYSSLKKAFGEKATMLIIAWLMIAIAFSIQGLVAHNRYNNYLIFKYTAPHLFSQLPLYENYPDQYHDISHYGPLFSLLMTPFSWLPDWIGLPIWNLLNGALLLCAIFSLPIKRQQQLLVGWLTLPEFVGSTLSEQFNPIAGALIIFSFVLVQRRKDGWAVLCILIGTLVKLYGLVGFIFFIFSHRKKAFAGYSILWLLVLLALPVLFSSWGYVEGQYHAWFHELAAKNAANASLSSTQDISIMGFARRALLKPGLSNLPFLGVGGILFASAFASTKQYASKRFQLLVLSAALITPVIFSTGSEDVTYVIAITGAALWFVVEPRNAWRQCLFILLLAVTFIPVITLVPERILNQHYFLYGVKAVPYTLIWLTAIYRFHVPIDEDEMPA